MQTYRTGIMSTVIQLEAPNTDVATVASILYFRSNAPIVFYNSPNDPMPSKWCKAFMAGDPGPEMVKEFEALAASDAVKTAYSTIKTV